MKQMRQMVRTVKQSILLRCLGLEMTTLNHGHGGPYLDEAFDPLVEELPLADDHLLLVLRVPELRLQHSDLTTLHPAVILGPKI
jgi:hypothetical protein